MNECLFPVQKWIVQDEYRIQTLRIRRLFVGPSIMGGYISGQFPSTQNHNQSPPAFLLFNLTQRFCFCPTINNNVSKNPGSTVKPIDPLLHSSKVHEWHQDLHAKWHSAYRNVTSLLIGFLRGGVQGEGVTGEP